MPTTDFLLPDPSAIIAKSFDCGKDGINTCFHRYAAKNMALNLNRTFVLPYALEKPASAKR